ncbi:UTRA domain-containing protein [Pseudochrobactrum sp. MP213Fo]|uniref:UTRA domain-containing protein n=1 Tax=Pseudochrobactrum sp. MP213Fo TaxID=3022250 RepID=UPI003BA2F7A5
MTDVSKPTISLSEKIQRDIETNIINGVWAPGDRIPNENEFMQQYQCSRMTVNRILSRLAERGLIIRRRKAGSFVAVPQSNSALFLNIHDFAKEAAADGQDYAYEILSRTVVNLNKTQALSLNLKEGHKVLAITCLHHFNAVPLAYEDRLISLEKVVAAETEPFDSIPPGTWLLGHVPWTEAKHTISAINADEKLARLLKIKLRVACLVLHRETWHDSEFVTAVDITYAGSSHKLTGAFTSALDHMNAGSSY